MLTTKQVTISRYLAAYPKAATKTLAQKAYSEHPALWPTLEACRTGFRTARGNAGEELRDKTADKTHYRPNGKPGDPFDKLPEGMTEMPSLVACTVEGPATCLVLCDVHIPYHDRPDLLTVIEFGRKRGCDTIVLNGDLIDCFALSTWQKDPRERDFKAEVTATQTFLAAIRETFPKARILYKYGNHETRYERYMMLKAPELLDIEKFDLTNVLGCPEHGVETFCLPQLLMLGKLHVIHGHEYRGGVTNPVNPARGLFLRGKVNALCGHFHQTSHHPGTAMDGKITSCWSVGCLCDLHPLWLPLNNWGRGVAVVEIDKDGAFNVENLRLINGKIWR